MTKDEALKLALEALENAANNNTAWNQKLAAITAIKEVLAQPVVKESLTGQQERNFCPRCGKRLGKNDWDVHTCTPPQFKPLTDEQISAAYEEYASKFNSYSNYWQALNSEDHFTEGYMAGWKDAHEARSKT